MKCFSTPTVWKVITKVGRYAGMKNFSDRIRKITIFFEILGQSGKITSGRSPITIKVI